MPTVEPHNPPPELCAALTDLWAASPIRADLYRAPPFRHVRATCERLFPGSGSASTLDFALARAMRALACPATDPVAGQCPMSAEEAAWRLDAAFRQTEVTRTHLCPLDMADHFPSISFGSARAGQFSNTELTDLLQGPAGPRGRTNDLDIDRLAAFRWLVVRETSSVSSPDLQHRALPELSINFNQDFGRIVPHARARPQAVDDALLALLLLPWEDHDTHHNPEWRVFRVPWIYTVEDDLFGRLPARPDVDTLTEVDFTYDDALETVTELRPYVINLAETVEPMVAQLDAAAWARHQTALSHPAFCPPIAHFFVRAFFGEPIDEFLAHVMTLEASLGTPEDYDAKGRLKFSRSDNPGAKTRVAARITALLEDVGAGRDYETLFELRSQYVHGRIMGDIPSAARLTARKLARRVVAALVDLAQVSREPRDDLLAKLVLAGIGPLRATS